MSENLLRAGFVGCGGHATNAIWPSLRYAPIEVAWACDLDSTLAQRAKRRFGAEQVTTKLDDVLSDDSVQAVFVVGPPNMHHSIGLRVIEAGKHLFTEKPPGETLEHALELQEASRKAGVQHQVGYMKRFALGYQHAAQMAATPEFGGIRMMKLNYTHWRQTDWRMHLIFMSVHPLDLMRFFMGDASESWVLKKQHDSSRATLVLNLIYADGRTAIVNMSSVDPHVQEWVELSGASTLLTVHNLVELRSYNSGGTFAQSFETGGAKATLWHPDFAIPWREADSLWLQGYAGEVHEFAHALLDGRGVSPSIDDGVATMRYVEAIIAAPQGMSQLKF